MTPAPANICQGSANNLMKAVVQRVKHTTLKVDGILISEISSGLVIYLGIKIGDTEAACDLLAKKIPKLRIFEDGEGKMNLSLADVGGEILLVSQFTLYGDCTHGNRPSFSNAERPERAKELYLYFAEKLRETGITVKLGVFGADMKIEQFNDGPVSFIYEI